MEFIGSESFFVILNIITVIVGIVSVSTTIYVIRDYIKHRKDKKD